VKKKKNLLIIFSLFVLLSLTLTKIPILVLIGTVLPISFIFLYSTQTIKKMAKNKLKEYKSIDQSQMKEFNSLNNEIVYSNQLINDNTKQKVKVLKKTKF